MKYTFLINQAGIVDAGLADRTDLSDWAILEYVAEWQIHSSARMQKGHVWLDYRHLMDEMPMLGIRTKGGVSNRVAKLRGLGLLSSFQADGNALYVKVTDLYSSIVRFRGVPAKPVPDDGVHENEQGVHENEQGVHENEQGVHENEQGVHENERSVHENEHIINNQNKLPEQTKLLGARASDRFADAQVFDQPMQWAEFFVAECQYPLHIVQTARTIPLFAEWVRQKVPVGDMRQAMAACHAWNAGRIPDSPVLYKKFLQTILDERKRLAETADFVQRPGKGRSRAAGDWAKVPRLNDDLWPWAKKHGYPGPGSRTYVEYRSLLYAEVEKRKADHGCG